MLDRNGVKSLKEKYLRSGRSIFTGNISVSVLYLNRLWGKWRRLGEFTIEITNKAR